MTPSSQLPASVSPEQRARWEERYGASRRTPVGLLAAVAVLVLAFLGWVAWAGIQHAAQEVRWRTVGFSDVSDSSVTVSFDVFKDADTGATCLVRVLDATSSEVGRAEVPVDAGPADVHVTHTLPVTGRPVTGEIIKCWVEDD